MKDNQNAQELQMLEQNLQNILMQKQAFQMEQTETESALEQIEISDDEVFKIVGQLMIKSDKQKIKDELSNKQKLIGLRLKTMEKQENSLNERLENLRKELVPDKKE